MEKFDEVIKFQNEDILDLIEIIEKEAGFKSSSRKSAEIMYHLYSKLARSVKVANLVLKSDIENNYTEAIPVLRQLIETYFHICYVSNGEGDDERILKEYMELSKLQNWKLGRDIKSLIKEGDGIHPDNIAFMKQFYSGKSKPNPPEHLEKIYLLAKSVGKYDVYVQLYSLFSSFIHFNPNTKVNLGEQIGDTFSFNKFAYDAKMDIETRTYICRVTLLSLVEIAAYFNLHNFRENQLKTCVEKWRAIDSM
ncbi:hypothetical protein GCM10010912_17720 [Paenibacillus albidus]|uniref:Uncharacterized protein n=1 Tax=Paenibacillus albidus TaxID=2041023 RepID=A0A917C6V8_9BACL|nr:DUF5677 domain-containing protein [Paenibacillus albidus]GGF72965.1 hypothetical protein GCM10010912_17720 [Paenibacillus albidus]